MEAGAECAASDEQEMGSGATLKPQSLLVGLVRAQRAVELRTKGTEPRDQ